MHFYLVAMIFIVFDIEIIFLYPWAVIYRDLGVFGLVEIVVFAVAVFVSFVYLISNGALDWGPLNRARRQTPMVSAERTTRTTVRRVGLEGRAEAPAAAEPARRCTPDGLGHVQGPRGPRPQLPHREGRRPRPVVARRSRRGP